MNFDAMWHQFVESGRPALVTVYSNTDGYTRSNLLVDDTGYLTVYDKSRQSPGLAGVDIGVMILKNSVLDLLPAGNVSFEREVFPQLVSRRQLQAHVTDHRYYSVGSHERLGLTEVFLARPATVLLDRDGVLNKRMPQAQYVRTWDEWEWLPGAREALRLLQEAGYRVAIISNQPGIARGAMTEDDLQEIHRQMQAEAAKAGGRIDAIYHCPHGWDEGCPCRKPKPGLLFQAQRDFSLDLSRTYFIGDDERDGQAAAAAGCPFILINDEPVNGERVTGGPGAEAVSLWQAIQQLVTGNLINAESR